MPGFTRRLLASLLFAGGFTTGHSETRALAAPNFNGLSYMAVTRGGVALVDGNLDTPTADFRNIVGGTGLPSAYVASDAGFVYFRLRLDESPGVGSQLENFSWNAALEVDGNLIDGYEFLISASGRDPEGVQIWQNTVSAANIILDEAELVLALNSLDSSTSTVDAGSAINGTSDFFLSWAVPKAVIGVNGRTSMRVVLASNSSGKAYVSSGSSEDLLGLIPGPTNADVLSDAFTCYDWGCVPGVRPTFDLNGDGAGDTFLYDAVTGDWSQQLSQFDGSFLQDSEGTWAPGWSIQPAHFNFDALSDLFLFNATSGQWLKLVTVAGGFTTQSGGQWWPGWNRHVVDLDGDGISDLFLYDTATGAWFTCISTPTGFTYTQGGWNPGWEIYPMRFNADALGDMFLISRQTGRWFWAVGDNGDGFTYPVTEAWFAGWQFYPGDFTGDGLTDLLLHDPPTGVHFAAMTNGTVGNGFAYTQGGWSLGWQPYVADFDANGKDDLFLHDPLTGVWFQMIGDGLGQYSNAGGQIWSLGWNLHLTDLNGDGRTDFVLYDSATGVWYQARALSNGTFAYSSGTWSAGLTVVAR